MLALAVAGCGGDDKAATTPRTVTATAAEVTPPVRDAPVAAGRRVFERSGCLACHQVLTKGNSGPGSNLTGIGARMPAAAILRALVDAPAPMPSYRELGRDRLHDLVAYLSALRGDAPGGPPCPDDVDCG